MIIYFIFLYLLTGIIWFLRILSIVIIANALLSWFLDPMHPIRELLSRFVNPVIRPFRILTDKLTAKSSIPIDISPILAYFAIILLIEILIGFQQFIRYQVFMY